MSRVVLAVVALVVVIASLPVRAAPCAGFTDVDDTSPFCVNVAWMRNRGITLGCTATLYCPNDFVTRLQMAAFMYRLGFQNAFLQGGNTFGATAVLGTDDAQPVEIHANSARVMRYEPNAISPNVIGGSPANSVTAGVRGATIAGGGAPAGADPNFSDVAPNRVTDVYGTVGGGHANRAGDDTGNLTDGAFATVGGGSLNTASGRSSTVGGGLANTASEQFGTVGGGFDNAAAGPWSTVGGGYNNAASGFTSTVAGGWNNVAGGSSSAIGGGAYNVASGDYSFATGFGARADQHQCFVFANWFNGGSGSCLGTTNIARFLLDRGVSVDYSSRRADGGGNRWIYLGDLFAGQSIATWTGAFLSNAGVWTNASDRAAKDGFAPIDPQAVLDGVVNLPITRWYYRQEGPGVEHIGPTAQDFKAAFGLGQGDTGIGTVDADGVAFAAIQGLNAKLEAKIAEQAREIAELRRLVEKFVAKP